MGENTRRGPGGRGPVGPKSREYSPEEKAAIQADLERTERETEEATAAEEAEIAQKIEFEKNNFRRLLQEEIGKVGKKDYWAIYEKEFLAFFVRTGNYGEGAAQFSNTFAPLHGARHLREMGVEMQMLGTPYIKICAEAIVSEAMSKEEVINIMEKKYSNAPSTIRLLETA